MVVMVVMVVMVALVANGRYGRYGCYGCYRQRPSYIKPVFLIKDISLLEKLAFQRPRMHSKWKEGGMKEWRGMGFGNDYCRYGVWKVLLKQLTNTLKEFLASQPVLFIGQYLLITHSATTTKICTRSCFTQAYAKSFITIPHALTIPHAPFWYYTRLWV